MTILSNPPVLTATRSVTSGTVSSGGLLTMTLNFRNSANNGTLSNVTVNDSWWTAYPSLFSLSAGNSSFTVPSLAPNQNASQGVRPEGHLHGSEDLVVPATSASYSYNVGNLTVVASTMTNQLEVRTNTRRSGRVGAGGQQHPVRVLVWKARKVRRDGHEHRERPSAQPQGPELHQPDPYSWRLLEGQHVPSR